LIDTYPEHPYVQDGYFLAGMSLYELKRFGEAASFFSQVTTTDNDLNLKALYKRGESLTKNESFEAAGVAFRTLYQQYGGSPLADNAMLQYAIVLGRQGSNDDAVKVFREFPRRFQDSRLQDDALFQLALLYYNNDQFGRAKDVFKEYDYLYPNGKYLDQALYLSGICSREIGEPTEALLLWDRVITRYGESEYRGDALLEAARLYTEQDNYRNAIDLYESLMQEYPNLAEKQDVQKSISELRFLIGGDTEDVAELKSIISRSNRASTPDGRKAMVELASLYILENKGDIGEAYSMLEQVIEKNDPDVHGRALYLLGEYFAAGDNRQDAYRSFMRTARYGPAQKTVKAKALYRAAEMRRLQGNTAEVRSIVNRLQREYPNTEWAEEAETLLEGLQ
jgi:TolA-binding protein